MAHVHAEHLPSEIVSPGLPLAEAQERLQALYGDKLATKEDLKDIPAEDLEKDTANFTFNSTVQDGDHTSVPCVYRSEGGSTYESARWDEREVDSYDRALVRD